MSRIPTATTLPNGDTGISTSLRLGGIPYNQPIPSGMYSTYSTDNRTLKNYTLIHLEPYWDQVSEEFKYDNKHYNLSENSQNNAYLMNYGVSFVTTLAQTHTPRWYKSTADLGDEDVECYFTNWASQDATWEPISSAPISDYYNYTYAVTDFKYTKVALYPYVEYDYRSSSGVPYRTSRKTALYTFFNDQSAQVHQDVPSDATDIGLFFGYELVYGMNSGINGSFNDNTTTKYTMYCLGKEISFSKTKVKHMNSARNTVLESYTKKSYQFAYSNNVLLGSTGVYNSGVLGRFQGFVGESSHMYESWYPYKSWESISNYYATTMGYGYEDGLAAALSKGLLVLETEEQRNSFNGTLWENFKTNFMNDHTLKAVRDGSRITENFIRGNDISDDEDIKNAEDGKNYIDEVPEYNPDDPDDVDPNDYINETPLNNVPQFMNPIGKFNSYFALSYEALDDFAAFLSPSSDNVFDDILNGLKLYGENPMDFILGLRVFPFDVTKYTGQNVREITFGRRVSTGVTADLITDATVVIDMGSCYFRRYYKNFLDYEPYCTAKLYIPYCGEIDIPTSVFLGHTIEVKMIVDLSTGGCTAVIYKDGIAAYYKDGQIGVEIPVTGMNNWEYVKTAVDVAQKGIQSIMQIGSNTGVMGKIGRTETSSSSAVYGGKNTSINNHQSYGQTSSSQINPTGIVGGVLTGLEAAYEFTTQPTPLQTSGSGMSYESFFKPQYCYFVVQQAVPMSVSGYGNDIGYACLERRKISSNDSYIVAQNPHVQPENATSQETSELNQLLSTGVWR